MLLVSIGQLFAQSPYEVSKKMFETSKNVRRMSFTMTKKERVDGEMLIQTSAVKFNKNPLKIYSRQIAPKAGLEVLYCEGENNGEVLVNPNGFPWFSLNLDPLGSMMRKNQHHTILNTGYDYVISIIEFLFDKYGEETKTMLQFLPDEVWDGIPCSVIHFDNPHFKVSPTKVLQTETLIDYTNKRKLSAHMIIERNESLDDFEEVLEEGETYNLPNDYSPKMTIYMDKDRMIPLLIKVYDDLGEYEIYEYVDVKLNPTFNKEDFSSDNSDYNF